jgi:hypothetical protein
MDAKSRMVLAGAPPEKVRGISQSWLQPSFRRLFSRLRASLEGIVGGFSTLSLGRVPATPMKTEPLWAANPGCSRLFSAARRGRGAMY